MCMHASALAQKYACASLYVCISIWSGNFHALAGKDWIVAVVVMDVVVVMAVVVKMVVIAIVVVAAAYGSN